MRKFYLCFPNIDVEVSEKEFKSVLDKYNDEDACITAQMTIPWAYHTNKVYFLACTTHNVFEGIGYYYDEV